MVSVRGLMCLQGLHVLSFGRFDTGAQALRSGVSVHRPREENVEKSEEIDEEDRILHRMHFSNIISSHLLADD